MSTSTPSRAVRKAVRNAVWVAFAVITLFDVASWRGLYRTVAHQPEVVDKAVFELQDDGSLTARAVPWHYPMVPHPAAFDEHTFLMTPGYPVYLRVGEGGLDRFDLRIYEEPAVALVLVRPEGEEHFSALSVAGAPGSLASTLTPVVTEAPPITASAAVNGCFPAAEGAAEDLVYELAHQGGRLVVTAGTCRWEIPAPKLDVVITSQASARLEMRGEADIGTWSWTWWILLLVVLGSLASRLALANIAWVLTDAVATLFVFAVSLFAPVWILIYGLKAAFGALVGAVRLIQLARADRRWRIGLGSALGLAVVAALVIDPAAAGAWYTQRLADAQIAAMNSVDDRKDIKIEDTTHLVLGYSTVNAAAAGRGAYGSAALDQVLQRTCGEGRVWNRNGVDGANICMMADAWNEQSRGQEKLQHRVFIGGFNDDISPSLRNLKTLLPSVMALVPAMEPFPSVEAAWHRSAGDNVINESRVAESLACLERAATSGGASKLTYIYDLGIFDLGRARGHGRTAWETYRRQTVEKAGGRYVDLRDLLPGESLMYFNDFVHPSEIGYQLLADRICRLLDGAPLEEVADDGAPGADGEGPLPEGAAP